MNLKIIRSGKFQLLIIILLTLIAYSNIFQNEFVGDDINLILNWDFIRHLDNIPKILTNNVFPEGYSRFRPIGTTMLVLYYNLFGPNPLGYHINSVIAFSIDIILVYLISLYISKKRLMAFITSFIFALHPIHSESVTEMLVSLDGLGYIPFFVSFLFFLRSKQNSNKKYDKYFVFSVVLAYIAFLSYEITLILPILIIWYDICFKRLVFKRIKSRIWIYVPYLAGAGFYLAIKTFVLEKVVPPHYLLDSFYLTMLTMMHVFVKYIGLLIWPVNLSKNHTILPGVQVWINPFTNINAITSQSIFDSEIMLGLGILFSLIFLAFKLRKRIPVISFAIGWFLISLLPVSYILPQDTLMQERYIYLGVFSFALIVSFLAQKFYESNFFKLSLKIKMMILVCILTMISVAYMYRIYTRNFDFRDQISFFGKQAKQLPNDIVTNYMLASAYEQKGQDEQSVVYYQKILILEPNIPNIYFRLGEVYRKHESLRQAIENYQKVLSLTPNSLEARKRWIEISKKNPEILNTNFKTLNGLNGKIFNSELFVFYPANYSAKEMFNDLLIEDPEKTFRITINIYSQNKAFTTDEYIKNDKKKYGILTNQRLVDFPNFEYSYLKLWSNEYNKTLQFYFFENYKIVESLVQINGDLTSGISKSIEAILGSLSLVE